MFLGLAMFEKAPGALLFKIQYLCHESRSGDDPSHHQRSPPPIFLDSIALIPHTCHSSHSQLFHITMDYLYTTLLLQCIAVNTVLCYRGHQHCFAISGVPFLYLVLFFALLAYLFLNKEYLTAFGPRPLFLLGVPCSHCNNLSQKWSISKW